MAMIKVSLALLLLTLNYVNVLFVGLKTKYFLFADCQLQSQDPLKIFLTQLLKNESEN